MATYRTSVPSGHGPSSGVPRTAWSRGTGYGRTSRPGSASSRPTNVDFRRDPNSTSNSSLAARGWRRWLRRGSLLRHTDQCSGGVGCSRLSGPADAAAPAVPVLVTSLRGGGARGRGMAGGRGPPAFYPGGGKHGGGG